jgi:hypothetical protein
MFFIGVSPANKSKMSLEIQPFDKRARLGRLPRRP